MPYVTSVERLAMQRGIEKGEQIGQTYRIERQLAKRFGPVSAKTVAAGKPPRSNNWIIGPRTSSMPPRWKGFSRATDQPWNVETGSVYVKPGPCSGNPNAERSGHHVRDTETKAIMLVPLHG